MGDRGGGGGVGCFNCDLRMCDTKGSTFYTLPSSACRTELLLKRLVSLIVLLYVQAKQISVMLGWSHHFLLDTLLKDIGRLFKII